MHRRAQAQRRVISDGPDPKIELLSSFDLRLAAVKAGLGQIGVNNNLITSSVFFRLNENWGFRMSQHFEARDGTIEEHFYSIYRDFRSWTGALTCRLRDSRNGRDDFTIGFTFSLKAISRMKLNTDRDYPTMLFGG